VPLQPEKLLIQFLVSSFQPKLPTAGFETRNQQPETAFATP